MRDPAGSAAQGSGLLYLLTFPETFCGFSRLADHSSGRWRRLPAAFPVVPFHADGASILRGLGRFAGRGHDVAAG